jgi:RNA polymerase sigma-70 factor (ECF subfamily)
VGDVDAMISLLTDDVVFTMPPRPILYRGRARASEFLAIVAAPPGQPYRLRWTRANGQPAIAAYQGSAEAPGYDAMGLLVLTLEGDAISAMTRFEPTVLRPFGLPLHL